MRRLGTLDWLLIGTSLPVLLFGVAMSVAHGVRGSFVFPPFMVWSAEDAGAVPVVRVVFPAPNAPVRALAVGDRVMRLDGIDLRGASMAGFALSWSAAARRGARSLRLTIERDGRSSEADVQLIPGALFPWVPWWVPLPLVLALGATALLLLLRAPHWHLARRVHVQCVLLAVAFTPYFCVPTMPRLAILIMVVFLPVVAGLILWTVCLFSPRARLWGRRQAACTVALCGLELAAFAAMFWLPDRGIGAWLVRLQPLVAVALFLAILAAITLAYRRSDPPTRRQIKWIVYGLYVGSLPMVIFNAAFALGLWREWASVLVAIAMIALAASPLGLLVAIAFHSFLDIDRLFGATLSYSLLAVVGVAIVLGVMPAAARAAGDALGLDPAGSQIFLSVGLALVLVPAQRVVRPRIDRLLFPERLGLQQGFERLLTELAESPDVEALTRLVGGRLDELLRPTSAVLYARVGDLFVAASARGRPAPPAFAAAGSLVATLRERTAPLAAERWSGRRPEAPTPFERAAIETLDAAVIMPIRRGAELVAFACLGPKRSGDVYTATDLALLGAVASRASDRLLALDAAAVADQARAMQAALRRFVPGAVAERIVSGRPLGAEEREVTVLFVDIRGYTGFSEARDAEEIFHTVNRYTETVSGLVQARGGVVVEFHGDGMLAIFGAPEELPMKERAAVQTARDVVQAIKPTVPGALSGLSVGIGIATGPAFVGNIQAADRAIWTALGNPVNLAARLQSLTRDLAAAVAVDDVTFRRARAACADFVSHDNVAIRGRAATETVHALPFGA